MTAALRAQILDAMVKVNPETLLGYSLQHFCRQSHLKTDEQIEDCVKQIQEQFKDGGQLYVEMLGDQFEFFYNLKLTNPERDKNPKATA